MHVLLAVLLWMAGAPERQFEVTATRYKFEPEVLEVTEGDHVVVTVRSGDVEHGWAIKALKLQTLVPKGGQPVRVEFTADKAGTYEIACSEYCGKGHRTMKGKLVVKPRQAAGDDK